MAEAANPTAPNPQTPAPPAQPQETPPKPPAKPQPEPTKPTDEELVEAKVQERLKAERLKDEQKALKDKAKAEADEAAKRGEFEKLHASVKAELEHVQAERDRERLGTRVIRALTAEAGKHAGYDPAKLESYLHDRIVAGLKVDADDASVAKSVAEAVKQFVSDFPLQAKGSAAPATQPGQRLPPAPKPEGGPNGNAPIRLSRITQGA